MVSSNNKDGFTIPTGKIESREIQSIIHAQTLSLFLAVVVVGLRHKHSLTHAADISLLLSLGHTHSPGGIFY